jgi:hypothetical protein
VTPKRPVDLALADMEWLRAGFQRGGMTVAEAREAADLLADLWVEMEQMAAEVAQMAVRSRNPPD